jgi:hypothetical protein
MLAMPSSGESSGGVFEISCSYASSTRTLNVTGRGDAFEARIVRDGDRILVTDDFALTYTCAGAQPTVYNVDLVRMDAPVAIAFPTIDLTGGPFVPGATDEGDGVSEIEFDLSLGHQEPVIGIVGSASKDRMTIGRLKGTDGAVNLDASHDDRDADVLFHGNREQFQIELGAGADRFSGSAKRGFDRPYRYPLVVAGGAGDDTLIGTAGKDIFSGETGHDNLIGFGGPDFLDAHDYGGPPDFTQFPSRDAIRCGPGHDIARADRKDRVGGCERID